MAYDPRKENAKKAARRRFEAREFLQKMKQNPCSDCGVVYHPCQMDFVRKICSEKAPVSRLLLRSIEKIYEDIQECELLCANCSRMRTWRKQREKRSGIV